MAAQAAEVGQRYVSAFIGQSEADIADFNDDDTSYRIGGGFRVNENFAVEGYYVDYGAAEETYPSPPFGEGTVTVEATAFLFQAVGLFPVSPAVDLYGKAGLAIWDGELCDDDPDPFFGKQCFDDDGTDLVFGFGGNFDISKQVTLRAEYEMTEFDDLDVTTIMLGLNVAF